MARRRSKKGNRENNHRGQGRTRKRGFDEWGEWDDREQEPPRRRRSNRRRERSEAISASEHHSE